MVVSGVYWLVGWLVRLWRAEWIDSGAIGMYGASMRFPLVF